MSKYYIPGLAVAIAFILGIMAYQVTNAQTPTPEPAPILTYEKSADVEGNLIIWTLSVTNSGDADSNSQTVQDTLPAGVDWYILEDNINCSLVPSITDGRLRLGCDPFIVPKRDLSGEDTDGYRFVTIFGYASQCGFYNNAAQFNVFTVRLASALVPCPDMVTPVPPTSTPVTVIPATETPTPVSTVTTPVPTSTPKIIPSITPKPPATGNGISTPPDSDSFYALAVMVLGLGILGMYVSWKQYKR